MSAQTISSSAKAEILNFPLIAPYNTSRSLDVSVPAGSRVYFGTGLVTPKAISQGLPFDFLGMLLSAEWVRQKVGGGGIIHEISDAHALDNPIHDAQAVQRLARAQQQQVTELAKTLGIEDYQCILASQYRDSAPFKAIQAGVDAVSPATMENYVRYQSAGNAYFAQEKNVGYKVGWLRDDTDKPAGLDERYFNDAYDRLGLAPINFAYTWSGRNFDPDRSFVSPYTCINGEKRLMLASERPAMQELTELVDSCPNTKIARGIVTHLSRIAIAYDQALFPPAKFGVGHNSFWVSNADFVTQDRRYMKIPHPRAKNGEQAHIDLEALANVIDKIRTARPRFEGFGHAVKNATSYLG